VGAERLASIKDVASTLISSAEHSKKSAGRAFKLTGHHVLDIRGTVGRHHTTAQ
jgi:hypothetical protein